MKTEKIKQVKELLTETEEREIERHGITVKYGIFNKRTGEFLRESEFLRIDLGEGTPPPDYEHYVK